jgi:hypothetical protein
MTNVSGRRPSRLVRRPRAGLVLLALLALWCPSLRAETGRLTSMSQTVRWIRSSEESASGSYLISYTSMGFRTEPWLLRAGMSWLAWNPEKGATAPTSRSGPSAVYFSVSRLLWGSNRGISSPRSKTQGWIRGRFKVPLREDPSVLGTGESDWGVSIGARRRLGRALLIAEAGYLDLGDPSGVSYRGVGSGSFSLSYRPRRMPLRVFGAMLASSPSLPGDAAYVESSLGVGFAISRRISTTVTGSLGLTPVSPREGISLSVGIVP